MSISTVSDKGQVVIPAALRRGLGIRPGTQLEFSMEGDSIRVSLKHGVPSTQLDEGYGMLRAKPARGTRSLAAFDVAQATQREAGGRKR